MKRLAFALLVMTAPAWAADVSMAFGEKIPPFSFPETNSGIELEIIGEALAVKGHVLKPRYFPFARVPLAFKEGAVDAAMTDLGQDLTSAGAHYGDLAVLYDNVLFTLRSRHLQLRKPADLQGLTLVSFQGAVKRYPEWLGPMKKSGAYMEVNDQAVQVKMLMLGRIDVVLSDRSIFRYFSLQLQRSGVALEAVDEHPFTAVNPLDYRPVFRSKQVRDDFNQGLLQIRKNGRYRAIYDKYLRE